MIEKMTHDQHVLSVRQRIVDTARAMIDRQLGFLAGARTLAALRFEIDAVDDADFRIFVAIDSDTDDLPIGPVREFWDEAALQRLAPRIEAAEAWAREQGTSACAALIRRYGDSG